MKSLNRHLTRFLSVPAFLIIFLFLFDIVSKSFIIIDNVDIANMDGFFYERKNSMDVVLMGQSEIYMGYAPGLAWEEYGIKSINFSIGRFPCNQYVSMLKEIEKRQHPKLLVVNATAFLHGDENITDESLLTKWVDNLPFSSNKTETIETTLPESMRDYTTFPIVKYHGNWKYPKNLLTSFLLRSHLRINHGGYLKGYYTQSSVTGGKENLAKLGYPTFQNYFLTDLCKKYFIEFLDECKSLNIENMLVLVPPHQTDTGKTDGITEIQDLAKQYGYDLLDLHNNYSIAGIDDAKDFADFEHLNIYGAQHFTSYLAKYMCDNYDVKSATTDSQKAKWDECAKKTHEVIDMSEESIKQNVTIGYGEFNIMPTIQDYNKLKNVLKRSNN